MSKVRQWLYLKDEEGVPLEDANMHLYLTGTETDATIFSDSVGTLLDQSTWTTGTSGFFDFYIGNEWSPSGYDASQYFDLAWSKSSRSGMIEGIQLFPFLYSVDETDTEDDKNKLLSNQLAYKFDQHADETYLIEPHDIAPVDTNLEDVTNNKVVSNSLINEMNSLLDALTAPDLDKHKVCTVLLDTFIPSADGYYTDLWIPSGSMKTSNYPIVQFYEYLSDGYKGRPPIHGSPSAGSNTIINPRAIQDISPSALRVYTVNDNWLMATVVASGYKE